MFQQILGVGVAPHVSRFLGRLGCYDSVMAIRTKRYLLKVAAASLGVASVSVACGTSAVGSVFVFPSDQESDASTNEPDGCMGFCARDTGPDTGDSSATSDVFIGKVTPVATKD